MWLKHSMAVYGFFVFSTCFMLVQYGLAHQVKQPYRTGYHFQPSKNWMNDPNGPMYYKGVYHLFYQYNPFGPLWGNITWGHSVSYDLVNWVHLENAISPDKPYDISGCWSGSVTILPGGKPVILYTGSDINFNQTQNMAFPRNLSDPLLREWIKSSRNPLMSPVDGVEPSVFRDPTTAWLGPDGTWRVIMGSQINNRGTAILYRSKDFLNWNRSSSPLHLSNTTGMWECPDFFPVTVNGRNGLDTSVYREDSTRHVLKAGFSHRDCYTVGIYESDTDSYRGDTDFTDENAQELRYDYGIFYASKTFFDRAKQRRVLWAWLPEADSQSDDIDKGWSGLQSFPRHILLSKTGKQLVQWPVEEIKKLHTGKVITIKNEELKGRSLLEIKGITASQADVEISFSLSNLVEAELIDSDSVDPQVLCTQKNASVKGSFGPFGLLVLASKELQEQTAIFFRVFRGHSKNYVVLLCSDQSRSSMREEVDKTSFGAFLDLDPLHENISLRSLIDHSVVESFGGEGRTCMTARVYPKLATDKRAHLYVFNNGTQSVSIPSMTAWRMNKARIGPIGKRRRLSEE